MRAGAINALTFSDTEHSEFEKKKSNLRFSNKDKWGVALGACMGCKVVFADLPWRKKGYSQ
jgi:hypothetical protein